MEKKIEIKGNVVNFLDSSGKEVEAHSMSASDISSIHVENRTLSKMFGLKKINTKSISITAQGIDKKLEVFEYIEGPELFSEYETGLAKFARDHHIFYQAAD